MACVTGDDARRGMNTVAARPMRRCKMLYGLSGDGLGHTMRARVIASHLRTRGHVVHMAACGRSARICARMESTSSTFAIWLRTIAERLVRHRTLAEILGGAPERIAHNRARGCASICNSGLTSSSRIFELRRHRGARLRSSARVDRSSARARRFVHPRSSSLTVRSRFP